MKLVFLIWCYSFMAFYLYRYIALKVTKWQFYRKYYALTDQPSWGYSNLGEKKITEDFDFFVQGLKQNGYQFRHVWCHSPTLLYPFRFYFFSTIEHTDINNVTAKYLMSIVSLSLFAATIIWGSVIAFVYAVLFWGAGLACIE